MDEMEAVALAAYDTLSADDKERIMALDRQLAAKMARPVLSRPGRLAVIALIGMLLEGSR